MRIGLSLDVNDCTRCPGIMASSAFSQILLLIACRFFGTEELIENLLKNLRPEKDAIYSRNIRYIFISDTALQKRTDIYSSFFRIKSLRAC